MITVKRPDSQLYVGVIYRINFSMQISLQHYMRSQGQEVLLTLYTWVALEVAIKGKSSCLKNHCLIFVLGLWVPYGHSKFSVSQQKSSTPPFIIRLFISWLTRYGKYLLEHFLSKFSLFLHYVQTKQALKFSEDPRSGLLTQTHTHTHKQTHTYRDTDTERKGEVNQWSLVKQLRRSNCNKFEFNYFSSIRAVL